MTTPTPVEPVITELSVATWLGMSAPDAYVSEVVPAVSVYVREIHGDGELTDAVQLGALMLAALIVRRRNSPGGVESFGELDPSFVARYDPTISQLLKLGNHRKLIVG
ncbi:hypothetical protein PBI_JEANIE_8 [Gordonia phage Jeanie]|uniref:Head-to-tail adaptor n=2 Tax=root TaxID=1 RepID=A0A160DHA9_9CAUD|nr:hypothetical protein [Gordonia neofelifaecis]YP_009274020.1 head-tail connector protein [Gordonia phage McGonagall]ANA87586.1 hypothetical protein MCGONAGALL_8 [Gordonia phage McGonagall]ANA87613.1 hypothetical protein PBI_JEANIE_8 [Gordonia phage Jeanie]EGD53217.1 hypothetical protein SCNU_20057 [Gordonia neofelifaecis NRRL B-59395]